jgi:hypothetical protein
MKDLKNIHRIHFIGLLLLFTICVFSCKKETLDNKTYGTFGESFPSNANEASAAVNYCYTGMIQETEWSLDWNYLRPEDLASSDELIVNWGWDGLRSFSYFTPDNFLMTAASNHGYTYYMKMVSQITVFIDKISKLNLDATTKDRYLGELKGLRGYYNNVLFDHFGPVSVRMNAADVDNPAKPYVARPTQDVMVNYIVSDLTDAIAVLPARFTGNDYGRFSKAAALTCRMKLYMNLKRWADAIKDGEAIEGLGYSLMPNYNDNFGPKAKGGNAEIILPIVCSPNGGTSGEYHNKWFAYCLPADFQDPKVAIIEAWNGWRMPWSTYRKFDTINDQRTLRLLRYYPINVNGRTIWRDALTGDTAATLSGGKVTPAGTLYGGATMVGRGHYAPGNSPGGAVPQKFDLNGRTSADWENMDMDFIVYRYADVLLLLAEAYNNTGQTANAIALVNQIRNRAGLANTTATDQASLQTAIENERLFELWFEFTRRDDLIRWGKYIQRAIDDGSNLLNPNWNSGGGPQKYLLYPIPRTVISQSGGIITQNPGY